MGPGRDAPRDPARARARGRGARGLAPARCRSRGGHRCRPAAHGPAGVRPTCCTSAIVAGAADELRASMQLAAAGGRTEQVGTHRGAIAQPGLHRRVQGRSRRLAWRCDSHVPGRDILAPTPITPRPHDRITPGIGRLTRESCRARRQTDFGASLSGVRPERPPATAGGAGTPVRNEHLGDALSRLVAAGSILRIADRWAVPVPSP